MRRALTVAAATAALLAGTALPAHAATHTAVISGDSYMYVSPGTSCASPRRAYPGNSYSAVGSVKTRVGYYAIVTTSTGWTYTIDHRCVYPKLTGRVTYKVRVIP